MIVPQDQFVSARQRDWSELDSIIGQGDGVHKQGGSAISRAAALYRSLCNDLVRAETARYTPDLMSYLHGLAGRSHNVLYGSVALRAGGFLEFILVEFPIALRKNWRFFFLSTALFMVPFLVGMIGTLTTDGFAEHVLPTSALEQMADMYSHTISGRGEGTDTGMAGFYVQHNVGIAFTCFATGIFFGLGSIFYLISNGLQIGTVVGYVMLAGHGRNIWTFMCGHGPWEITAIFVAGGAGLQMGYALVATGGLTRFGSLRRQGKDIIAQVLGAAVMLGIAALIEGFWSPSGIPAEVKWGFAAVQLVIVFSFLTFGGRWRARRPALGTMAERAPEAARPA
ncbi:MAG TPA: stage II sporulation protein M [Polyangiaceae bacterium]|nr:stage II sporulation protein M [Polyangiaceae bacterium]